MRYVFSFLCVCVLTATWPQSASAQIGKEGTFRLALWQPKALVDPASKEEPTLQPKLDDPVGVDVVPSVTETQPRPSPALQIGLDDGLGAEPVPTVTPTTLTAAEQEKERRRRAIGLGVAIPVVVIGVLVGVGVAVSRIDMFPNKTRNP